MRCPHGKNKFCGVIERVNVKSIRVLFDGEDKSGLIKRCRGFFKTISGQEKNDERNPEDAANTSKEDDDDDDDDASDNFEEEESEEEIVV